MKKTFKMVHPKIKPARLAEAARNDVRKYVKRERKRELPEGVDFWDFDCKFGDSEETAEALHLAEVNQRILDAEAQGVEQFYVEILRKHGHRTKKPVEDAAEAGE